MYSTIVCKRSHLYSISQTCFIPVQVSIIIRNQTFFLQMNDHNKDLDRAYSHNDRITLKISIMFAYNANEKMIDLNDLCDEMISHDSKMFKNRIEKFYSYISFKIKCILESKKSVVLKDIINNHRFRKILIILDRMSNSNYFVLRLKNKLSKIKELIL